MRNSCAVCGVLFESENDLISCPAHSFGERYMVVDYGYTLQAKELEKFRAENHINVDEEAKPNGLFTPHQ